MRKMIYFNGHHLTDIEPFLGSMGFVLLAS